MRPAVDKSSRGKPRQGVGRADQLARSVAAPLDFDLAFGQPLGPDHDLPGNADQIRGGELGPGALVGEFIGADRGLGNLLLQLNYNMDISGMFAVKIEIEIN